MKIIAVLAMTPDRLIGNAGKLPWNIPEDLAHFQKITKNNTVIMGRKTYFSLPKKYRPLPKRRNIVLSRNDFSETESYTSLESLLASLKKENLKKVCIIGGIQIYQLFFDHSLIDEVYCTLVSGTYEGNEYIPEWRENFLLSTEQRFSQGLFQHYVKKDS